jgi:uncharacterized protein YneF (UPF0154 family)
LGHTRATFLKQLHLRKKIEENPILQKEAYREVMQSMMHERRSQERSIRENSVQTSKMQQYVGRVRNRRGDYDPLDASSVLMNDTESSTKTQNNWMQASQRLHMIEAIARFKEDKMRREFLRLQDELKAQEERERFEKEKDSKRQRRMMRAKKELEDFHQQKEQEKVAEKEREKEVMKKIR